MQLRLHKTMGLHKGVGQNKGVLVHWHGLHRTIARHWTVMGEEDRAG